MSLSVDVYHIDADGNQVYVSPREGQDLAGPESWRTQVYGSQTARDYGLILLPRLTNSDLHVAGADLAQLNAEVQTLIDNVGSFAQETGNEPDHLRTRLLNILHAVQEAQRTAGGVSLW